MTTKECIFCKIVAKKIPAKIIHESDTVLVIEDIHPKAPVHYLILPKKHIDTILAITEVDAELAFEMFKTARDLVRKLPEPQSCNLISNNGAAAGQSVMHMHWHFLSGRNLYQGDLAL